MSLSFKNPRNLPRGRLFIEENFKEFYIIDDDDSFINIYSNLRTSRLKIKEICEERDALNIILLDVYVNKEDKMKRSVRLSKNWQFNKVNDDVVTKCESKSIDFLGNHLELKDENGSVSLKYDNCKITLKTVLKSDDLKIFKRGERSLIIYHHNAFSLLYFGSESISEHYIKMENDLNDTFILLYYDYAVFVSNLDNNRFIMYDVLMTRIPYDSTKFDSDNIISSIEFYFMQRENICFGAQMFFNKFKSALTLSSFIINYKERVEAVANSIDSLPYDSHTYLVDFICNSSIVTNIHVPILDRFFKSEYARYKLLELLTSYDLKSSIPFYIYGKKLTKKEMSILIETGNEHFVAYGKIDNMILLVEILKETKNEKLEKYEHMLRKKIVDGFK